MSGNTDKRRNSNYNIDNSAINEFDEETLLRVYGKIVRSRLFELGVVKAVEEGRITVPVYLSLGQESATAAISELVKDYYIFTQHRAHDLYVSIGGSLEELRDELLCLPSGYCEGKTGSNCISYWKNGIKMAGHNGCVGENVSLAAGCAIASSERTVCVFGDGGAEEDYVISTVGFAVTNKLPLVFICMDNDLSVLTTSAERRSWDLVAVAQGFGMNAYDLSDCPWNVLRILKAWDASAPILLNIRVCRERWHVGTGVDNEREWERDTIVRKQLIERGLGTRITEIEATIEGEMEELWKN